MSTDVKERISTMGHLFAAEGLVDLSITAIDSTSFKVKGHVWHKSSMKKGIVPRSGIDTDAKWDYSHTKDGFWMQTTSNMIPNRRDYKSSLQQM